MKKCLAILISLLALLGSVQFAYGCSTHRSLSKIDLAFADLVFDGKIIDVKNGVHVFEIKNIVEGEFSERNIEVGMVHSWVYRTPKTVEDFIDRHGLFVRVGVSTLHIAEKFCKVSEDDLMITARSCSEVVLSTVVVNQKPIIVGEPCTGPYIVPAGILEKSRIYAEKYKKFEDKLIEERPDEERTLALYDKIVGDLSPIDTESYIYRQLEESRARDERYVTDSRDRASAEIRHKRRVVSTLSGALGFSSSFVPNRIGPGDYENQAVELFRENPDWFMEGGEKFESDKALLSFLGVDFSCINKMPRKIGSFYIYQSLLGREFSNTTETLEETSCFGGSKKYLKPFIYDDRDIELLAHSVRQIKRFIEIDPSFADRLLVVDREPSFWSKIRDWRPW